MYEQEINRVRVAILKGLTDSSRNLLNAKIKNNRPIAIMRDDRLQVIPARSLYR